jgi:putative ABC transport system permease protein
MTESVVMTAACAERAGISYTVSTVFTDREDVPSDGSVLNIQSRKSILDSFDTFMDLMNKMIWLLVIAAVVLGIVVLYNLGIMSYTERYREMATLKVVGFRDSRIGRLLISQNLWLTVIGIAIGIPAGAGVLQYLLTALASEYELKLVLGPATWLVSVLLTFGVSLAVGLMISRKNRTIDMVAALKTEE